MHFIISLPQLSNSPTPKHADITILSRKKGACGELDGVTEIPTLGTLQKYIHIPGIRRHAFLFLCVFSSPCVSLCPCFSCLSICDSFIGVDRAQKLC